MDNGERKTTHIHVRLGPGSAQLIGIVSSPRWPRLTRRHGEARWFEQVRFGPAIEVWCVLVFLRS